MSSKSNGPEVVRISRKGQATIPKALRERFDIEAPGEVFVYEDEGRLVLEPVPSGEELHGIHASDAEPGEVLERTRDLRERDRRREAEREERVRPGEDG